MSVIGSQKSQGLIARVIGILTRPQAEWDLIAPEAATAQSLMLGYAAILAAVPAIARAIHALLPACFFGVCYTPNPVFAISAAVAYYIITLASVFVMGLIIDAFAPSFGGEKDPVQALKVAVYGWTAAWLAGVFIIVPWFGALLSLVGLYSLYLLYTGIPKLMKAPQDKSLVYTIVVVVLAVGVCVVGSAVATRIAGIGALAGGLAGQPGQVSGTVNLGGPTGAGIDLGKLQAAGKQIEAQAKAQASGGPGKIVAIDPEKLKGLLPDNVGGAPRTEIEATTAGGASVANAQATYSGGDVHATVTITDLGAAGGLGAFATAMNVQSDKQTATGYEKVSTINGRLTTERYDTQSKNGEFSVLVGNRFNVDAQGSGVSIDALKAAVAAVGPDRLDALARG